MLINKLKPALMIGILLCILPANGQESITPAKQFEEYSLKAVFALNFARLTHWPYDTSNELSFCIMGNSTMQSAFKSVDNQLSNSKLTRLKVISRDKEITQCQILFISGISHNKMRKIYSGARNHPILTISEVEDINRSGAIINFIKKEDKIRFQINMKYAQQAGLKISSRLLNLAVITEK